MAVHLRLQRHGKIHRPFYHLVATDHRKARNGEYLERLGHYDPSTTPSTISLNAERIKFWYAKGACLSTAAKNLLKINKISVERERTEAPAPRNKKTK